MHRNVTLKFDSSVKSKSIARQSSPRIKLGYFKFYLIYYYPILTRAKY